jgi:hypothetical protein
LRFRQSDEPRQLLESQPDVVGSYKPGMSPCGVFHGPLGKMVEGPGQAAGGLEEELLGLGFKQVGMNGNLLKAGADIRLKILRRPRRHLDAEAEAGEERPVDSEEEPGHKVVVADEQ